MKDSNSCQTYTVSDLPYPENLIQIVVPFAYFYDIDTDALFKLLNALPPHHLMVIEMLFKDHAYAANIAKAAGLKNFKSVYSVKTNVVKRLRQNIKLFVKLKPRQERLAMTSSENLLYHETFIYGFKTSNPKSDPTVGFLKNYDKNMFMRCRRCNKRFRNTEYAYRGSFYIAPNKTEFRTICRNCAYAISDYVIEKDGNKIETKRRNNMVNKNTQVIIFSPIFGITFQRLADIMSIDRFEPITMESGDFKGAEARQIHDILEVIQPRNEKSAVSLVAVKGDTTFFNLVKKAVDDDMNQSGTEKEITDAKIGKSLKIISWSKI